MQNLLKLEILPRVYQVIPLQTSVTIGRDLSNKVVLNDLSISSKHALIKVEGENAWLEDLNSTNGTQVNGDRIQKKCLQDGDRISIGYIVGYFLVENSIDKVVENATLEDITFDDDTTYQFQYSDVYIQKLLEKLENFILQKFPHIKDCRKYLAAIFSAIQNAYFHGNKENAEEIISIHFQLKEDEWRCTITDQGSGYPYKQIYSKYQADPETYKNHSLGVISEGTSYLEFNTLGTAITLVKINVSKSSKTQKNYLQQQDNFYFSMKFYSQVIQRRTYPLHIILSSHQLKSFPEHLDTTKSNILDYTKAPISIEPIVPGCLVVPASQTIREEITLTKLHFWVTPLTEDTKINAKLHLTSQGRILAQLPLQFQAFSTFLSKFFLSLGILIPFLGILLDIPLWKMDAEIPSLVRHIIILVQTFGGLSNVGIFLGILFLGLGTFQYYKTLPRPKDMVQEKVEM
ncbi:MAG TPA: FHA domain-containing protein [Planctomycetota bacterium]|nr:FHA domain-containing protein [Planctomycetota bacterium]